MKKYLLINNILKFNKVLVESNLKKLKIKNFIYINN